MKLSKVSKLSVIIVAAIALSACASNKKKEPVLPVSSSNSVSTTAVSMQDNQFGFIKDDSLSIQQLLSICTYYFKFDSTAITGANLQAVQAQGNYLSSKPKQKVLLKGYTDIQGSREYNIGLGYRRAKAVASELISKGTNKNQIEMVSYGPEFPADEASNQEAYQKNRRVELVYCETSSCKSVYGGGALKGKVK